MAKSAKQSRASIARYVMALLGDQYGLPPSYFKEGDDLRDEWRLTDDAIVEMGKAISKSPFQSALITPKEIVRCKTIGDIIDLIMSKL